MTQSSSQKLEASHSGTDVTFEDFKFLFMPAEVRTILRLWFGEHDPQILIQYHPSHRGRFFET
jgi:hypothetical protein